MQPQETVMSAWLVEVDLCYHLAPTQSLSKGLRHPGHPKDRDTKRNGVALISPIQLHRDFQVLQ